MKIVLVSKCSLDIEQYVEFKMSVLISPSKSLISSRWVTNIETCTLLWCDWIMHVPALSNFQKADFEPYPVGKKYTTFFSFRHEALALNICLRDAPTCSCIQLCT